MRIILLAILMAVASSGYCCTTILVGKDASRDHSVMIARNDDHQAVNAQHYVVHPRHDNPPGSVFTSSVSQFTYPNPRVSLRYSSIPQWSNHDVSHEEAGINERGVGVSATETIYNNKVALQADPYVTKTGVNEDSIASILLRRMTSVREGIQLLGHIIATRGAAEGFGVAIGDKNSVWYLETASGHRWVAMRIPDNSYFVAANQVRIQHINLKDPKHYLGSVDLIRFAIKHHLYNPKKDGAFDFRRAYSRIIHFDIHYDYMRLETLQRLFNPGIKSHFKSGNFPVTLVPRKPISVYDVESALCNHYERTPFEPYAANNPKAIYRPISLFRTQHSHILVFYQHQPRPIGSVIYLAMGMPTLSFYVPFYQGYTHPPRAYDQGTDHADDDSAYWKFRTLQTIAMTRFRQYYPIVAAQQRRYNQYLIRQQKIFVPKFESLYNRNPTKALTELAGFNQQLIDQAFMQADALTHLLITLQTHYLDLKYHYPGG